MSLALLALTGLTLLKLPFVGSQAPTTQGWYSSLWSNRKTIYTDTHWPLPPAGILFEGWPRQFHASFLLIDLAHLVYWLIFVALIYLLVRRYAGILPSLSSTLIVSLVAFAQPGNIVSGYFETHYLLGLGALLIVSSKKSPGSLAFSIAVCLAVLSWGVKQTGILAFILVLLAYYIRDRSNQKALEGPTLSTPTGRRLIKFANVLVLGILLAFPFMLIGAGGLRQLWASKTTFLGSGGKTPSARGLLPMLLDASGDFTVIAFLSIIFLSLRSGLKKTVDSTLFLSMFALLYIASALRPFGFLGRLLALSFIVVVIIEWLLDSAPRLKRRSLNFVRVLAVAVLPSFVIYEFAGWIFRGVETGDTRSGFIGPYWNESASSATWSLTALFVFLAIYALAAVLGAPRRFPTFSVPKDRHEVERRTDIVLRLDPSWMPLFFPILLALVSASFLGPFALEMIVPLTAVGLALLLQSLGASENASSSHRNWRIFVLGLMSALITLTGASWFKQFEVPYSWFGINGAALTERSGADGSFISSSGEMYFDRSNRFLLHVALEELAPDDALLFGPRNVGLTVGSNKEVVFQNCIVLWWDVCPEQEARKDLEMLKSGGFEYALWTFEGSDVIANNEYVWRGGRSSAVGQIEAALGKIRASFPERVRFIMSEDYHAGRETVLIDLRGIT